MILNNYYAFLRGLHNHTGASAVSAGGVSGMVGFPAEDAAAVLDAALRMAEAGNLLTAIPATGGGVLFGDGSTTATAEDYGLAGDIVTGVTEVSGEVEYAEDETGITYTATLVCTATDAATVREVGYAVCLPDPVSGEYAAYLLDRTVLSSAVDLEQGQTLTLTYAMRVNYPDASAANAAAEHILQGYSAIVGGVVIEGTMPNNGDTSASIDGLTETSATIPAGYTTGGTVALTGDVEDALSQL